MIATDVLTDNASDIASVPS